MMGRKNVRTLAILVFLGSLAACSGGEEQAAPTNVQAQAETGVAAQVARLDEGQRNGVFERAIRASGAICTEVSQSERAQVRHGVMGWKAQCLNGDAHLIEILGDGTAKVTSRTH